MKKKERSLLDQLKPKNKLVVLSIKTKKYLNDFWKYKILKKPKPVFINFDFASLYNNTMRFYPANEQAELDPIKSYMIVDHIAQIERNREITKEANQRLKELEEALKKFPIKGILEESFSNNESSAPKRTYNSHQQQYMTFEQSPHLMGGRVQRWIRHQENRS